MGVVLETKGLTKRYGSILAVDDLSLAIQEGEVFGLLGPNGAGKTTLISMMCGLLKPDRGHVVLGGRCISHWDAAARVRVGVCPQSIVVWGHLTCLEQLVFVGEMYGLDGTLAAQRAMELLQALDLVQRKDSAAQTLSGGMQRRLNVALALVHDPELLVLDEPEAGLDPQSRVLLRDYLRSLARKKTIILTTHNMDEAERMADRVAIIDHGRLLALDTPENLRRSVGEGDVLEIETAAATSGASVAALTRIAPNVSASDHTLVIRAGGMVELLPAILEVLQRAGEQPRGIQLRANTLEDVFISLTGRGLRE